MREKAVRWVAVAMSAFQLYTAAFGTLETLQQRAVHFLFTLVLVFATLPTRRGGRAADGWSLGLLLVSAGSLGYFILRHGEISARIFRVTPLEPAEWVAGLLLILVTLEAARRSLGPSLSIVSLLFLGYALLGQWLPGNFGHGGFSLGETVEQLTLSTEGIFGIPLGVSATYAYLFILFGILLSRTGLMALFSDLALALAGNTTGGAAKVAVICSAFFGMISGSGIANAVTTGAFTVPLMMRAGYPAAFAAAVEACASMGGNIMPPVMGAAAFIMADNLGMPYVQLAIAATIPAVLYFFSAGAMVHFKAAQERLARIPRSDLPRLGPLLRRRGHLLVPVMVLVGLLLSGRTALFAGFWSIVAGVAVGMVRRETRPSPRQLLDALEQAGRTAIHVAVACGVVGIIVGVVNLTGFGLKLAGLILSFSGGYTLVVLFLTMLATLVIGTGLPTTPTYIIVAALTAPALTKIGISPLAAHMFVFYYGILADLTPPTAIAPYTLAGMFGADPNRTSWTAFSISLSGFLIPFIFATDPSMLDPLMRLPSTTWASLLITTGSAALGIVMLSGAIIGYFLGSIGILTRVALGFGALTLMVPSRIMDLVGLGLFAAVVVFQRLRRPRGTTVPDEIAARASERG